MTKMETTLSDDQIVDIAETLDKCLLDIGTKHKPQAIELASIALGRLMVLCKQLNCYDTFHQLMGTVVKMGDFDFTKTGELNDDVQNDAGNNEQSPM